MMQKVEPRCPYFGTCGGCQLQHLAYDDQLELKRGMVRESMEKQGLGGIKVRETLGMEDPWFYRNKIQFPIRQQNQHLQMGYFKQKTHAVVNIKECYIQDPFLTEIALIAREIFEERGLPAYDESTGNGLLRHLIGRSGFQTREILLGIVINGKGLPAGFTVADEIKKQERLAQRMVSRHRDYPHPEKKARIVSIIQNINTTRSNVILGKHNTVLFGAPFLREKLGRFFFEIQLNSFFQVNPLQAEKLYDLVRDFAELSGKELVVDAYAGIGAIAFWLSTKAERVIGLEESAAAVKDAGRNITLNNLNKVKIELGMTENSFPKQAEVVVLDPPRGGCSEKALRAIIKSNPQKIIYVSCNPETLARDLRKLSENNFEIKVIQPVDMFPQTEHVEVIAKLVKLSRTAGN
jgi:23S rRNA (uracil1939-C5)-methyltransferase